MTNLKVWLKGLAVAVLSSLLTAALTMKIAPESFNFSKAGLLKLLLVAAPIALKATLLYLKQSPLDPSSPGPGGPGPIPITQGQNPMKNNLSQLCIAAALFLAPVFVVPALAQSPAPAKKPVKQHALAKIARAAAKPFTATAGHPKRTAKQILGSVLFGTETIVDGARIGLEGADKAFDAISIQGKVPVLDAIYAGVSQGAKDAAKLDVWLEKQEQGLFGTHN